MSRKGSQTTLVKNTVRGLGGGGSAATLAAADDEVAAVGDQADALADNQDGVGAEDGVGTDGQGAYQGYPPEACGEHAPAQAHGVEPLVDEAEGEDDLSGGAVEQQPKGDVGVGEEAAGGSLGVADNRDAQCYRQDAQQDACPGGYLDQGALDAQVPQVDVVGEELAEDDGEV